ncbi:uncharacterized protein MONOS_16724 [Monocercomonoides exilis]|uniref:uncharacterized protein n=1 Tax=Monocercomonoides exilis TaxID=2049356 RepID=UPI00355ACC88|nr:hypothetical protein MONOS_16724 [Monocercomonoides exilis]|eukprot:MONOS_16724.1-p1 / transcript=MONOS_16724.1 / gene=MONOS_16724 / organism=Monocercomonoides_exilis_PA203 / gene_product=unspecified product / transcript_product=unspecified product / location=Mono_scaffold02074:1116-1886(-) / protein_length=257 / sequence_SO=supercontig / SO=protein_coding / is_pseudo=false
MEFHSTFSKLTVSLFVILSFFPSLYFCLHLKNVELKTLVEPPALKSARMPPLIGFHTSSKLHPQAVVLLPPHSLLVPCSSRLAFHVMFLKWQLSSLTHSHLHDPISGLLPATQNDENEVQPRNRQLPSSHEHSDPICHCAKPNGCSEQFFISSSPPFTSNRGTSKCKTSITQAQNEHIESSSSWAMCVFSITVTCTSLKQRVELIESKMTWCMSGWKVQLLDWMRERLLSDSGNCLLPFWDCITPIPNALSLPFSF